MSNAAAVKPPHAPLLPGGRSNDDFGSGTLPSARFGRLQAADLIYDDVLAFAARSD
ncbi:MULTISPECIES: hypothetical protein [Bradyrhizobium]|uniref:hypothetical protein n=1 Tax=Bradyrhizobium TaxID=374 RepID=UPI0002D95B20|nr:hypothetical protein [Bradyrhizobium japonicum]MCS3548821.1 hypothetical protein [Bradyrhizobium japonicum]MCS3991232.1 hypothetical protein [Bradyrhizobium japonicum]MCS4013959.1 hypothetical protein [Bradyrhizobium japonicum]MDH6171563.1 hypothetical protein [Bradyrhizobium japonicum]MYV81109.1 hypothetical protein [Bradyrhizobium japonicum]